MEPIDALRRIAYLLEADAAETYKVRAFRNAAAGISEVDDETLQQLASSGRLQTLPGVGKTTAGVIGQALSGETPEYLSQLETSFERLELSKGGAKIRKALRGDCHTHSEWSDGGSSITEMAEAARQLGHDFMVLTDHSPRLTVAHGLNPERLRRQLQEIEKLNESLAPFRILTGIEVDILEDGSLDQDPDLLSRLDVVVASVHSKLSMDKDLMTARMIRAVESPLTDILGHCTGRKLVGRGRPPSSFDSAAVFDACARTDTAVEINSRPERQDPPPELLDEALELGCRVSIDTDAHAPGQLEWLVLGCEKAAGAEVAPRRIVNASSADDVVAWAKAHEA